MKAGPKPAFPNRLTGHREGFAGFDADFEPGTRKIIRWRLVGHERGRPAGYRRDNKRTAVAVPTESNCYVAGLAGLQSGQCRRSHFDQAAATAEPGMADIEVRQSKHACATAILRDFGQSAASAGRSAPNVPTGTARPGKRRSLAVDLGRRGPINVCNHQPADRQVSAGEGQGNIAYGFGHQPGARTGSLAG